MMILGEARLLADAPSVAPCACGADLVWASADQVGRPRVVCMRGHIRPASESTAVDLLLDLLDLDPEYFEDRPLSLSHAPGPPPPAASDFSPWRDLNDGRRTAP